MNEHTELPELRQPVVRTWIRQVAALHGKTTGDVCFLFCDDEKILEVNNQYLQHDYFTDIITFDYSSGNLIAGDLFISTDTVNTNAIQFGTEYDHELHRVMIHGVLHLCGYGDSTPAERQKMTELENEALHLLTSL